MWYICSSCDCYTAICLVDTLDIHEEVEGPMTTNGDAQRLAIFDQTDSELRYFYKSLVVICDPLNVFMKNRTLLLNWCESSFGEFITSLHSESDPEETPFEREFIDINRRRSLRKHKENTLSPNALSPNKVQCDVMFTLKHLKVASSPIVLLIWLFQMMLSECSVSPVSNFSGKSHLSGKTASSAQPSSGMNSRLSQVGSTLAFSYFS